MKIKTSLFLNILFPVSLLAFVCVGISFIKPIFDANTRWIPFLGLIMYVLIKSNLHRYLGKTLMLMFFYYWFWCVATSFWSEVPALSFMKSGLFFLLGLAMITAGGEWVRLNSWPATLNCFALIVIATLLAGILGAGVEGTTYYSSGMGIYTGLADGANMMGSLLAMSFPFLLWHAYNSWGKGIAWPATWLGLIAADLLLLVMTHSRSAMIVVTLIGFCFTMLLRLKQRLRGILLGLFLLAVGLLAMPSLLIGTVEDIIYKDPMHVDVFASRENVWAVSSADAAQGGWLGVGFGAAVGKGNYAMHGSLQTYGYGREKGSSQLAILEETGIIGLILYSTFFITFIFQAVQFIRWVPDKNIKILMGILLGAMLGMIGQSAFEAWWGAPAAPEGFYFWAICGLIRGVMVNCRNIQR